jgi:hypothetical protein
VGKEEAVLGREEAKAVSEGNIPYQQLHQVKSILFISARQDQTPPE